MFRFSPYERYMMPAHFGPANQDKRASGWYRDVTTMIVPFVTDREKLSALLPEPFTVGEQPVSNAVRFAVQFLIRQAHILATKRNPIRGRMGMFGKPLMNRT